MESLKVKETVRFIRDIRPAYPSVAFFTPYPGTELGDYCARQGMLLENTGAFYNRSAEARGKLKGIDYAFLKAAAERAQDYDRHSLQLRRPGAAAGRPGSARGLAARAWDRFREDPPGAFAKTVFKRLRSRWLYLKYGLY